MLVLPLLLTFAFTSYSAEPVTHTATCSYTISTPVCSAVCDGSQYPQYENVGFTVYADITYNFLLMSWPSTGSSAWYLNITTIDVDTYILYDGINDYPDYDQHFSDEFFFSPFVHFEYSYDYNGVDTIMDLEDYHLYFNLFSYGGVYLNISFENVDTDVILDNFSHRITSAEYAYVIFNTEIAFDASDVYSQISAYLDQYYGSSYEEGYNEGYTVGYSNGSRTGYNTGYSDGYSDGSSTDQVATSIFLGIINIALLPINMFLKMLNFTVFGVNIGGFVSALLTVAIAVILIRIIIGGNKSDS